MATVQEAPGELELVRQFVNTNDVEDGIEKFASPELLRDWLSEHGFDVGEKLTARDVAHAIEVREALRRLLLANGGEALDRDSVARLNDAAARIRLYVRFDPDGESALAAEGEGLEVAIGEILAIVHRAMENGTWPRLKACRADTCQWAFYDKSRNRSAHWCTMAVCGNRAKARSYRERHTH